MTISGRKLFGWATLALAVFAIGLLFLEILTNSIYHNQVDDFPTTIVNTLKRMWPVLILLAISTLGYVASRVAKV